METAVEAALRKQIMEWVGERAEANGGFLHRAELLDYHVGTQKLPVIDYSRGIRRRGSDRPDRDHLSWRFERFAATAGIAR